MSKDNNDFFMGKPYPAFQYSVFLKGSKDEQLVIRAENWEEFKEYKKKANAIIEKVQPQGEPEPPAEPRPEPKKEANCNKCGAEMVLNPKTGKWFCVKKCWLKK